MEKYYEAHGRKKGDENKEEKKEEMKGDDLNEGIPLSVLIDNEVNDEIDKYR